MSILFNILKEKIFMRTLIFSSFVLILLSLNFCRKDPSSLNDYTIELTAESVECTDAWLSLKADNIKDGINLLVKRDTVTIYNSRFNKTDTLLHDSGLTPNTEYDYSAYFLNNNVQTGEIGLTVTTMDTTGHNFTWQVYDFGGGSSSILNDIAIIDENDIWAVGSISTAEGRYNAVHWDGAKWELTKVPYIYQNQQYVHPLNFCFHLDNQVYFGGNGMVIWTGYEFKNLEISSDLWGPNEINKMWGISIQNLNIVGNNGSIARYNGQEWTKIESGTELDIQDIWGSWNESTGEYEILCVASNYGERESQLLGIEDGLVKHLDLKGLTYSLDGIWFKSGKKYFIGGGSGIKINNVNIKDNPWIIYSHDPINYFYIFDIAANDINDVIAVGGHGGIMHYNGTSWKNYIDETAFYGNLTGVDMKGDLIAAAGYTDWSGRILIGKRN